MRDQAEKLRQIIDNMKTTQEVSHNIQAIGLKKKSAKVITVTSGKGGVGKTSFSVNLGIILSEMGLRVIILDADFGLANIDVLFGIIPQYSLADVIHNRKNILEILCEGPNNIKFISGGSGVEELTKLNKNQLNMFVENIALLDSISDVVIVDTGAGVSDNVMSFVMAAEEVVLVTTPEPTSITDAYALIKMVSNRDRSKLIKVIVNRAESAAEADEILKKLSVVANKFLGIKLQSLGYVFNDETVARAVKLQQPFCLGFPKSQAAKQVREISARILNPIENSNELRSNGMKGFINKLINFLNS